MKKVKFKNGRYGVRTGNFLTGYKFLNIDGKPVKIKNWDLIYRDCQFLTLKQADIAIEEHIKRESRQYIIIE